MQHLILDDIVLLSVYFCFLFRHNLVLSISGFALDLKRIILNTDIYQLDRQPIDMLPTAFGTSRPSSNINVRYLQMSSNPDGLLWG